LIKLGQRCQEIIKAIFFWLDARITIGDEKHNEQLSKQRATMVQKELVRMGVNPHRISIKAAGEAPGPKVDAHNRRVDILFLDYK
jgi:outer membrane protein OmpA-like peptidoglycan-associated protein